MNKKLFLTAMLVANLTNIGVVQAAGKSQRGAYVGIFAGGGAINDSSISQSTTIYNRAGIGGSNATNDLSVSSQGTTKSDTAAFGGFHAGYEFSEIPLGQSGWGVRPALEFEGYYLKTSQSGYLSNPQIEPAVGNLAYSLPAGSHSFKDSFDLDLGVMLINGVFSFKTPWSDSIFPYLGGGVGANISARRSFVSTQLTPVTEPYINHANGDDNGSRSGFAAQGKAGVRAELIDNLSMFIEYRFLHVTASNYVFGPTFYPLTHPETTEWSTHFGSVNMHSGVLGIDYSF